MATPNNIFPQNIDETLPGIFDKWRLQKLVRQFYTLFNNLNIQNVCGNNANLSVSNVILTGLSFQSGTSITATVSNNVAKITHNAHGYTSGDFIVISSASSSGSIGDFNQLHLISVTGVNTYTFSTTATGTISSAVELFWFKGSRCLNANKVLNVTRPSGTGIYVVTFVNTQNDIYFIFSGIAITGNTGGGATIVPKANTPFTTTTATLAVTTLANVLADAGNYLNINFTGII